MYNILITSYIYNDLSFHSQRYVATYQTDPYKYFDSRIQGSMVA